MANQTTSDRLASTCCARCDTAGHAADVRIAYLARLYGIAWRAERKAINAALAGLDGATHARRCYALEAHPDYQPAVEAARAALAVLMAALDEDATASAAEVGK